MAKIKDLSNLRGFEQALRDASAQDGAINADLEVAKAFRGDRFAVISGGGAGVIYDTPLGAASGTYTQWQPYQDFTGYAIWRIGQPSNFAYHDWNVLYTRDRRGDIEQAYENKGAAQALNAAGFSLALVRSGTGSALTDVTAEAASDLGTEFIALEGPSPVSNSTHYLYLGVSGSLSLQPFQAAVGVLQRAGANLTLFAEYYSAQGYWTSGTTAILQSDATSSFLRSGLLQFSIPVSGADRWAVTYVGPNSGTWIRLGSSTTPSQGPKFYSIRPASGVADLLYRSPEQVRNRQFAWTTWAGEIFATLPDTGPASREGIDYIQSGSSAPNRKSFFTGFHRHYLAHRTNANPAILVEGEVNLITMAVSGTVTGAYGVGNTPAGIDITATLIASGGGFNPWGTSGTAVYIGCKQPFDHIAFAVAAYPSTVISFSPIWSPEYMSGSQGVWASLYGHGWNHFLEGKAILGVSLPYKPWGFQPRRGNLSDLIRWIIPTDWVSGTDAAPGTRINPGDSEYRYWVRIVRNQSALTTPPKFLQFAVGGGAALHTLPQHVSTSVANDVMSFSSGTQLEGIDFKKGGDSAHLRTMALQWDGISNSTGRPVSGNRALIIPRPDLLGQTGILYDWTNDLFKIRTLYSGSLLKDRSILLPDNVVTASRTGPADYVGTAALTNAVIFINSLNPGPNNRFTLLIGPGDYVGSTVQFPKYTDVVGLGMPILSGSEAASDWGETCYHLPFYSSVRNCEFRRVVIMSGPSTFENNRMVINPMAENAINHSVTIPGTALLTLGLQIEQVLSGDDPTIARNNHIEVHLSGTGATNSVSTFFQKLIVGARINNHYGNHATGPVYFEDNTVVLSGGHPIGVQTVRFHSGSRLYIRRNNYEITNPLYDDWHHVEMTNKLPEWTFIEDETVFARMETQGMWGTGPVESRGFLIHTSAASWKGGGTFPTYIPISEVYLKNVTHVLRLSGTRTGGDRHYAFGNEAVSGVALFLDNCVSVYSNPGGGTPRGVRGRTVYPGAAFWDVGHQLQQQSLRVTSGGHYVATYIRGGYLPATSGSADGLIYLDEGHAKHTRTLMVPLFASGTTALQQDFLDATKYWDHGSTAADPTKGAGFFAIYSGNAPSIGIRSGNKVWAIGLVDAGNI